LSAYILEINMTKRWIPTTVLLFAAAFSLPAGPAGATSVRPPADLGQLARISRAVVLAQAIESRVEPGDTLPMTITRFQTLEQVAGKPTGFIFEVQEPGGSLGKVGAAVAGAPRFEDGHDYLLFLDPAPGGRWRSKILSYGLLEEAPGSGLLRPLKQAAHLEIATRTSFEPVGVYHKTALLKHLGEVARGARWNPGRVLAEPSLAGKAAQTAGAPLYNAPQDCVYLQDESGDKAPIRWFGYEDGSTTVTVLPTTPGQTGIADGGTGAIQEGTAAWRNQPNAVMRFNSGASRPSSIACSGNFDYDSGAVIFNDPCNDLADLSSNCVGTLAFGGAIYDNTKTQTYDGNPWHPITSLFVVVNNGAQCVGEVDFKETLTHELGHTQGFGHHTPANPADATMSAFLKGDGRGASLGPTDKVCASFDYHTFLDVPYADGFWGYIEAIQNAGITNGCSPGHYCPADFVNRAEMAVFLIRASHGTAFTPPPATGRFQDVPTSYWAADSIEQLAADRITTGCSAGHYCPGDYVSRAEMAAFLVRVKHGPSYTPPPATGIFADVPASYWAAAYIEQIYNDGITTGCASNPLRYCPVDDVSRGQMAAFLARAFSLPLP
jgi:hypothetical protein